VAWFLVSVPVLFCRLRRLFRHLYRAISDALSVAPVDRTSADSRQIERNLRFVSVSSCSLSNGCLIDRWQLRGRLPSTLLPNGRLNRGA
jgi:hypothetical protein